MRLFNLYVNLDEAPADVPIDPPKLSEILRRVAQDVAVEFAEGVLPDKTVTDKIVIGANRKVGEWRLVIE